jgi:SAM-dependent methyltransferase
MIRVASRYNPVPDRCEFVVNRRPDLQQFSSGSFDLVHSCLVLQHMPADIALRYIAEFLRVSRPGGLVVFQLPAEAHAESSFTGRYALSDDGYAARILVADPPTALRPGECATLRVQVTNVSPVVWAHDIPAGRHICIANHWLGGDGTVEVPDDGRAFLPQTLGPGETCEVRLRVQAPATHGERLLEVDLVQERVCWFAERGSPTARIPVSVRGEAIAVAGSDTPSREQSSDRLPRSWTRRLIRLFRRGTPTFEMHVVPRREVEAVLAGNGGRLLHAIDDGAAGYRWLSYTYVVRRT